MKLSSGKLRGLQQLANPQGLLTVCALDHRESLKRALNAQNPETVSYQDIVDFKLDLCREIAPLASAVLLDPVYGAAQAIAGGVLPGSTGLLVSMEKSGYSGDRFARITELLPGWNAGKVRRLGASAVKLLLYFRPDLKDITDRQLGLVSRLADDCSTQDIPLLVEPVSYPTDADLEDPQHYAQIKPDLVIETARQITALPIDVLKSQFPADLAYESDDDRLMELCHELNKASRLPWVLLSAGISFDLFKKQVKIACQAGASGFLAGRALWQEAAQIPSREERRHFFRDVAAPRLGELAAVAGRYGKPWYAKMGATDGIFTEVVEHWYQDY